MALSRRRRHSVGNSLPRRIPPTKKSYVVCLSQSERAECRETIRELSGSSQKVRRAQMLLKVDQGEHGPGWIDRDVAEAFDARRQTVENLRKRPVTEGFEVALHGKPRLKPPNPPKLDGRAEAQLIALRTGEPPAGYGQWTLRLLAEQLVELEVVDSISHETVRQCLKKTGRPSRRSNTGPFSGEQGRPRRTPSSPPAWGRC